MIDKVGLKKALTRIAVGIGFLCAYVFMLMEISTLVNQVIVWITGLISVLYGLIQYRNLKAAGADTPDQSDPPKLKRQLLDAVKIPAAGSVVIALYYFSNPMLASLFYWASGLWLFVSGFIIAIKLYKQGFTGKSGQEKNVIRVSILTAVFIMLDAIIFGSFFIMGVLLLLLILIPSKLFKAIRQRADKPVFKQQLISAGIYVIAAVLSIVAFNLNNNLTEQRLTTIAAACEQYKQKYGIYPAELPKLIPEFIDKIPAPKIGFFMTGKFRYSAGKDSHDIMYVKVPPFGRQYYTLETKQWGYMD